MDWFKIVFLKDDFSHENRLCERWLLILYLFKFFLNLKKHLKVVFCKDDFYIIFFWNHMWKFYLQKTIFVQIFLKFEKCKSCLYKRRLSFKIFWNLKKHLKVVFILYDFLFFLKSHVKVVFTKYDFCPNFS